MSFTCPVCLMVSYHPDDETHGYCGACHGFTADFSGLLAHLGAGTEAHADRDGLTGVRRAVFLTRGGHAPGTVCPSEPDHDPDPHAYWCASLDDECNCGGAR